MRAVIQRVKQASVSVSGELTGRIGKGFLVFLGICRKDTEEDMSYIAGKVVNLRAFEDDNGKMNLNLADIDGEVLVVSQFTLFGDCRKGRRPSFSEAAAPGFARKMYEDFISEVKRAGIAVETGAFREMMEVSLINDGPVTFLLDSTRLF